MKCLVVLLGRRHRQQDIIIPETNKLFSALRDDARMCGQVFCERRLSSVPMLGHPDFQFQKSFSFIFEVDTGMQGMGEIFFQKQVGGTVEPLLYDHPQNHIGVGV